MSEKIPPKVNPANHPVRQKFASNIEHSHFDAWRVFRIMAEFVESFEDMAEIDKPLVTVFGSARTPQDHKYYQQAENLGRMLAESGYGVLTGGGAEYFQTLDIFHQVCDLPSRIGKPLGVNNMAMELNSPRYSTVYGTLRYGHSLALQNESRRRNSLSGGLRDKISGLGDIFARSLKNLRNNMKI